MRILHYLPRIHLSEGGVVRAVLDICALLAEEGHDVTLATHSPIDVPSDWNKSGAPSSEVIDPPNPILGYGRGAATRVQELVRRSDVVHLHTPWLRGNVRFAHEAKRAGVPYCVSTHGMLDDWCLMEKRQKKLAYLSLVGRRILEQASMVHFTAEAEREQACRHFRPIRAEVIPLTFDTDSFQQIPDPSAAREAYASLQGSAANVLFLSRIHHKKGIEILLRSIGLLRDRGVDAHLLIAGSGDADYTNSLKRLTGELKLDEQVSFLGQVGGELKVSLLAAADVFALSTSQENFGLAITESLACGTPVITTRGVDIWPELEASGSSLIVDQTPEAFADAIEQLIRDKSARREMGSKGRAWVLDHLNPASVTGRYIEAYSQLSQKKCTEAA